MVKIGRPRKDEQERRSDHLNVRLTIVERATLDAEARRLGLPVSSYVRRLIGKRRPVEAGHVPAVSGAVITALNRVGNNLNQLACSLPAMPMRRVIFLRLRGIWIKHCPGWRRPSMFCWIGPPDGAERDQRRGQLQRGSGLLSP